MTQYYVYELINPFTNNVFYVGKGQRGRMYEHQSLVRSNKVPNNNYELFRVIKEIHTNGGKVKYNKVYTTYSEDDAYDYEHKHIQKLGFDNLTNLYNGRGGVYSGELHPMYGRTHSVETKRLIGLKSKGRSKSKEAIAKMTFKGENHPMWGKTHSESTKQLMSENHADFNGESNPFYGKTHSSKTKLKLRNKLGYTWCIKLPNGEVVYVKGKSGIKEYVDNYNKTHSDNVSYHSLRVNGKNKHGWVLELSK